MPVSELATRLLLQTGTRRDPKKTCSEDQLRCRLRDLGLPEYETAIAFERDFGGMISKTWDEHAWGTYAALLDRTPETVWATTTYKTQEKYHGEPLLPIGVSAHHDCTKRFVRYWISRAGWILLDTGQGVYPLAESATCFFEREALRWGLVQHRPRATFRWREIPSGTAEDFARFEGNSEPDADDDSCEDFERRQYLEDPDRLFDQQLAEALALALYGPASDCFAHVWYDSSNLLFPHDDWQSADRVVCGNTAEDVLGMIVAMARIRSTVGVIWKGPPGEAPQPEEDVAAKVASVDENRVWRGHLLVIGQPGRYRMHEQLFDKPRYIARIWEALRENWEAVEKRRLTR